MEDRTSVKLLLADDDLELLRILRRKLSSTFDCTILEANNGEEALSVALEEHPDVIVLDVMMPVLNGWEVCKYLRGREDFNDVGIIMLTAIGPSLNELTSPLYGADNFLDKPFDFQELEDRLIKLVKEKKGFDLPRL